jgi:hypothetical protein
MYSCSLRTAAGKVGPDWCTSQNVLLIPASNCVYETPIWIGHYVLKHSYLPPDEFRHAVMSCPEPGLDKFRRALIAHIPELSRDSITDEWPFFDQRSDLSQLTLQSDLEHGDELRR